MSMKRRGCSYRKRVEEVNALYDRYAKLGVPNRTIWQRYVYPVYGISERTFYNILNAAGSDKNRIGDDERMLLLFPDWK